MGFFADDPQIIILKKAGSYHAVIAEKYRVKHIISMKKPSPTVIAALEYLLDVTSEHLSNMHDLFFADRATPPTQFGETEERDLFISRATYESLASPPASEESQSISSRSPVSTSSRTSVSVSVRSSESVAESIENSEATSVESETESAVRSERLAARAQTPFSHLNPLTPARAPKRHAAAIKEEAEDGADVDHLAESSGLRRSTRLRRS